MPAVKRIVEGVSGVPANAQRLLCRGRVLADEASMESARVEDGDTLLLVTRAPETEANPNLARDPHAPENAEARGNGRGEGTIGDLSQMITSLLTANPAMLGAVGPAGGAVTVEFSIGGPPMGGGGARAPAAGQRREERAAGRGGRGQPANATATTAVQQNTPEETLRRYLQNVLRLLRGLQVRSTPLSTPGDGNSVASEDASRTIEQRPIHFGVQCDACEVIPVRGTRYKSVAHDDYDLCERCFFAGRGAACGPYAKLDLPLPAGLPPVVQNDDETDMNQGTTREQRSEADVDTLGGMLSTAGEIARQAAPLIDVVAARFARDSRQNTVETQAANLQVASLMHSVGALWCELARCMAVVPPPPGVMTPQGAAIAGDDINNAQSFFSYPQVSYIANSGEFPHTRPPGMPLHTQDGLFVQGNPQAQAVRPVGVMHVMHQVHGLQQGLEGLPPELRELLMRQAAQATPAPGTNPAASAATTEAQQPPPPSQMVNPHGRRQAQAQSSQRALSRFLGSVLRAIPSPSFMTSQADHTIDATTQSGGIQIPTVPAHRDSTTLAHDLNSAVTGAAGQRPPVAPSQPVGTVPTSATSANDSISRSGHNETPNRARTRGDSKEEDANGRAAKASNTGNGMSPAASAAHLARDQATKSNLGASTSHVTRNEEDDKE